ncbi:MAG: hypothetical protein MHPSP_000326 [Paramarteilia canceri]
MIASRQQLTSSAAGANYTPVNRVQEGRLKLNILEKEAKCAKKFSQETKNLEEATESARQLKKVNENLRTYIRNYSKTHPAKDDIAKKQKMRKFRKVDSLKYERKNLENNLKCLKKEFELIKNKVNSTTPKFKYLGLSMPFNLIKKTGLSKIENQIEYEKLKLNELSNVHGMYKYLI